MRDRTRDWSERGRRPRLCLSLAPVSQLLWTRKERDCVQSMILCTARFLRVLYAEICDCCEMFIKCRDSLLLHRLNVKQGRMTYWKVVLLDRKACWCWARTCKIEEWNLPVVWWHGVWNFTEKIPQVSPRDSSSLRKCAPYSMGHRAITMMMINDWSIWSSLIPRHIITGLKLILLLLVVISIRLHVSQWVSIGPSTNTLPTVDTYRI